MFTKATLVLSKHQDLKRLRLQKKKMFLKIAVSNIVHLRHASISQPFCEVKEYTAL